MDILYAFLALAGVMVFLLLCVIFSLILRDPKHKAAWASISGMIGGIYSSTLGAFHFRYKTSGSYQGIPLEAFIETHDVGEAPAVYTYHLRIKAGAGRHGWTIRFNDTKVPGAVRIRDVESRDEALKRQLMEAVGLEPLTNDSVAASVEYKADKGTLEYKKTIDEDTSVPTPAEFEAQFKLLKQLAELSERVNVL